MHSTAPHRKPWPRSTVSTIIGSVVWSVILLAFGLLMKLMMLLGSPTRPVSPQACAGALAWRHEAEKRLPYLSGFEPASTLDVLTSTDQDIREHCRL